MAAASLPRDHVSKVVVVGKYGVGKSCLIHQLSTGAFVAQVPATVGVDFVKVELRGTGRALQLWDIAGQQNSSYLTKQYYRYAEAGVVVVDVTDASSLIDAESWVRDFQARVVPRMDAPPVADGACPVPLVVFYNKTDLAELSDEDRASFESWAQCQGFAGACFTTATVHDSVAEAFATVGALLPPLSSNRSGEASPKGRRKVSFAVPTDATPPPPKRKTCPVCSK